MHLLAERFVFLRMMIGVSRKRESRPISNGTNFMSWVAQYFFFFFFGLMSYLVFNFTFIRILLLDHEQIEERISFRKDSPGVKNRHEPFQPTQTDVASHFPLCSLSLSFFLFSCWQKTGCRALGHHFSFNHLRPIDVCINPIRARRDVYLLKYIPIRKRPPICRNSCQWCGVVRAGGLLLPRTKFMPW